MPGERRHGMDHDHYDWSPISTRGPLTWPGDNSLAVCAVVVLEHLEWDPPDDAFQLRRLPGGLGRLPFPDYVRHTHREYGHRVGIFRVLDALDAVGVPATVAVDALTAERYPWLVQHCARRGCELIGHGVSLSQAITSAMDETTERAHIERGLGAIEQLTGTRPTGWFGPEYSESARTPQLLADAGVTYVCDWPNDEQPYPMHVDTGELTSLPILLELDDAFAMGQRRVPVYRYAEMITEAADVLRSDGAATTGRLLTIALRPWLSGQPFRIGAIEKALRSVMDGGAWAGPGAEIVSWYRQHLPAPFG